MAAGMRNRAKPQSGFAISTPSNSHFFEFSCLRVRPIRWNSHEGTFRLGVVMILASIWDLQERVPPLDVPP